MKNPLQLPFEMEFSPWQDWACFLGAMFLLAFPLLLFLLIVWALLALR